MAMIAPAAAFVPNHKSRCKTMALRYLPSVHDVSMDEFTEQVYHASAIVRELSKMKNPDAMLSELLTAQLSHQDGIRGFFAVYVTGEGTTIADNEQMPVLLLNAIKGSNLECLASVAGKC